MLKQRSWLLIFALAGNAAVLLGQDNPEYDHRMGKALAPAEHPALNTARAAALTKRGCSISQFLDTPGLDGVVTASFYGVGTNDQAILCHERNDNLILIFGQGSDVIRDSIAREPFDKQRSITVASPGYVIDHLAGYGAEAVGIPNELDSPGLRRRLAGLIRHAGINDGSGCCSGVYFWWENQWRLLPGAD